MCTTFRIDTITISQMGSRVSQVQVPQMLGGRFDDFEEFREAAGGWDLDWRQLDRGPLEASLVELVGGPAVLSQVTFNRRFLQRGNAPPGVTFGMVAPAPEIEWCGQAVDSTHLLRFSPETGYESVSGPTPERRWRRGRGRPLRSFELQRQSRRLGPVRIDQPFIQLQPERQFLPQPGHSKQQPQPRFDRAEDWSSWRTPRGAQATPDGPSRTTWRRGRE